MRSLFDEKLEANAHPSSEREEMQNQLLHMIHQLGFRSVLKGLVLDQL